MDNKSKQPQKPEQPKQAPNMAEILADYDKAVNFLRSAPAEIWTMKGEENALSVFNYSLDNIKAYKTFLKTNNFNWTGVKNIKDFSKIPLMEKKNYFDKYSFNETNTVQAGKNLFSFALSSGTTGTPTLWPRYYQAEESAHVMFGLMMRLYWNIDKKSTLFINAANLGVYASGIFLNAAVKPLTQKFNITLATTGSDLDNIIHTVKQLSSYYDQTIIISYPTFTRTILDQLDNSGINIKELNLKLFIGGEGHTVEWRRYINKLIGNKVDDLISIIDGYTVTEASIAGIGTPLCNLIRNLCTDSPELNKDVFGFNDTVPNLCQFNPMSVWLEEIGNEIIFTTKTNTPLVRYNIHDRGGIIPFRDMEKILSSHNIDYKKEFEERGLPQDLIWEQPFVFCRGRRDDTVIIGGGNIYPEQIEPALINSVSKKIHSFKLKSVTTEDQKQKMYVLLELKKNIPLDPEMVDIIKKEYHDMIFDHLMLVNADYSIAYKSDPDNCDFYVEIYENGTGPFEKDCERTKPKLVVK